jgi:hypothetical protein
VANSLDGTISRLDVRSGRQLGPALPAGPAPSQLATGGDGSVLVLPAGAARPAALAHVVAGRGRGEARPVPLESGAWPLQLAGDGDRFAAVAYVVRPSPEAAARPDGGGAGATCRVALIDVPLGHVVSVREACGPGERVTGLAVATDETGTVAYVGLWGAGATGGGRIVALDVARGGVVTHRLSAPLGAPEAPGAVALAPTPDGSGRRLYVVTAALDLGAPPTSDLPTRVAEGLGWRLLGLNPTTLEPEAEYPLPRPAYWLTVSADGRDAYAYDYSGNEPAGSLLQRIDLVAGTASSLGRVRGLGVAGLVVVGDRLFIADTHGDRVIVVDRAGQRVTTLHTGRRPLGIATGSSSPGVPPAASD